MKNTIDSLSENIPYRLLRLGLACNANCLFCNVPVETYPAKEMSTQEAKREIAHLISLSKKTRLDVTGGEPTIRKDLEELINYASKKGISTIQVQTNGILLSHKDYVKNLKAVGLNKVFIGLHSSIPKIHDYLVGLKGAFKKCIEGIKNSLESNIEVILNPVITTKNYECLPEYIKFIRNNFPSVSSISLSVVQPRGRAWKHRYLIPRYKMIGPYIKEALSLGNKYRLIINNPYCGLPLCIGSWYQYLEQCVEYCENILKIKQGIRNTHFNQDKVKTASCSRCDLNNFCNGVWREYIALYPLTDLKPIRKDNGKFRLYSVNTNL